MGGLEASRAFWNAIEGKREIKALDREHKLLADPSSVSPTEGQMGLCNMERCFCPWCSLCFVYFWPHALFDCSLQGVVSLKVNPSLSKDSKKEAPAHQCFSLPLQHLSLSSVWAVAPSDAPSSTSTHKQTDRYKQQHAETCIFSTLILQKIFL